MHGCVLFNRNIFVVNHMLSIHTVTHKLNEDRAFIFTTAGFRKGYTINLPDTAET